MKIKGGILTSRKAFVLEHFGAGNWDKVVSALPADDQTVLHGLLLPSGWYAFDLGRRLDEAIVHVLGHEDPKVFEKIGVASAEANLRTTHRHFLVPGDPMAFMARASTVYDFYYDTGRRTWEPSGASSGLMTTYDAETFSTADCLTVVGWYRRALEMCGAQGVAIVEEACRAKGEAVCRYRVSWGGVGPGA